MRFLLLEKIPQITPEEIKKWDTASDKVRGQMGTDIINRFELNAAKNMMQPLRKSFVKFGIDPKTNPFIEFTDKLCQKVPLKKNDDVLFDILVDKYTSREVNLDHDYLVDASLYSRTPEEFEYTLFVFETVLNPSQLSKYFKDTKNISVKQLYDGGRIKPAGDESTADDTSTLFGTVESWSGEDRENNAHQQTGKSRVKSKDTIGPREKQRLKKTDSFGSLEDIKNPEIGQRVHISAGGKTGPSSGYSFRDVDDMTSEKGFYEYNGTKWIRIASDD